MTSISRRRRKGGSISLQCDGLYEIDNLIQLERSPLCVGPILPETNNELIEESLGVFDKLEFDNTVNQGLILVQEV